MAGGVTPLAGGAAHVAGGRGFLGAAVVPALRSAGLTVSASGREGLPLPDERANVETLIWCAGGREGAPAALWQVHVEAACAAVSECPALRAVIYVSSGEVYGAQPVPYLEDAPRLGVSHYALSKIRGEDAISALCWHRGLDLTIVRPSLVYGPEQAAAMLLPSAIRAFLDGKPFPATAGEQTRDWIFVEDVAQAIATIATMAIRQPSPRCQLYNLSSERERTVRGALALAAALVDDRAPSLIRWGALPYREHETMRYALSSVRARRELDWAPRISFEDGLAACIAATRSAHRGLAPEVSIG